MSLVTAKSTENLNFKFFQLRKIAIAESIDNDVINNLALSNAHQVIFAASGNAFKVIKISALLDYEWDKKNVDQIISSYPALEVKLPFKPSLLSVSGGSNSTLLVFGQNSSNLLSGDIYDVPSLVSGDLNPVNRIEFPVSISLNVHIQSVAWHPEFSETLFAANTSSGSLVTVGIDHQTRGVQLLSHYTDSFKFTCVSWSPKGKQLVVGGDNGQLTQFKHQNGKNFQKAKAIPAPQSLPTHKVQNIHWVHSALFQVAYVHKTATNSPDTRIVFIHAPAKATPEYYDFGYVCMETNQYEGPNKIQITLSQMGNILLCLSSLSNEVSVIGCESTEINPSPTSWQQWMLDDSSRIELSGLSGNDAYPRGVAWFKGPTKVFKINESVSIGGPGWPLVFVLSSAGILCLYYAYHLQGNLVIPDFFPSQPLPITVPPPTKVNRADIQAWGQPQQQQQQPKSQIPLTKSANQAFPVLQTQNVDATFNFTLPKDTQEKQKPQASVTVSATIQAPFQQPQVPQTIGQIKPEEQLQLQQQQQQQSQQQILLQQQQQQLLQQQPQGVAQQVSSKPSVSEEELKKKEQEVMEETFGIAINEEIAEFSRTLQNSKVNFSKGLNLQIGKPEELATLQTETSSLHELLKTSADTLKTLDINMLNGFLLETMAMVQEAQTRIEKESDPVYTMLANRKSIDPVTARKMREIKKMAHEIKLHLADFNTILDREWDEYAARISAKKMPRSLSSIDMVYHTLSTHHKTIEILKQNLSKYDSYLESIELEEVGIPSPRRKEIQEMINTLKNTSIRDDGSCISDDPQPKSTIKFTTCPKEKKEKLLEFFEQRNSVPVRRAILPYDLKSSKMLSAVVKAQERLKEIRAKSVTSSSSEKHTFTVPRSQDQPKKVGLSPSMTSTQLSPIKVSEKGDPADDRSLLYSTAIGEISLGDTSTYQSPNKSMSFIHHSKDTEINLTGETTFSAATNSTTIESVKQATTFPPFSFNSAQGAVSSSSFSFTSFSQSNTTSNQVATKTPSVPSPSQKTVPAVPPSPSSFSAVQNTSSSFTTSTPAAFNLPPKQSTEPATSKATDTGSLFTFSSTGSVGKSTQDKATSKNLFGVSSITAPSAQPNILSPKSTTTTQSSTFTAPTSLSSSTTTVQTTAETKPSTTFPAFSFSSAPVTASSSSFSFSGFDQTSTVSNQPPASPATVSIETTTTQSVTTISPAKTSDTSVSLTPVASTTPDTKPTGAFPAFSFSSAPSTTSASSTFSSPSFSQTITSVTATQAPLPTSTLSFTSSGLDQTSTTTTPIPSTTSSSSFSSSSFGHVSSTSTQAPTTSATFTGFGQVSNSSTSAPVTTTTSVSITQVSTALPSSPSLFGGGQNTSSFFSSASPASFSLPSQQTDATKANEPAPAFNFGAALANLGGQPSQDKTSKNVFGATITPAPQTNLFSSPKSTVQTSTFGAPSMSTSFAAQGTATTQTGFNSFGAQNQPRFGAQPTFGGAPAFGAQSTFGGSPTFGTQPTFGGSPTFGSGLPFGKSIPGSNLGFSQVAAPAPQAIAQPAVAASPFSGFANANTPSFGALASQQAPTFGQLAAVNSPQIQPQPQPAQQPATGSLFGGFGQQNTSTSIFGNTFSAAPAAAAAPAFGSPQFSQRRQ